MRKHFKKVLTVIVLLGLGYAGYNAYSIYTFSHQYFEDESDVAIVLGAGTSNGQLSPIFEERVNHAIYLFEKGSVKQVLLTGGFGEGQSKSDSRSAMEYAIEHGIPADRILIEESSRYTIENLQEARTMMDSLGLETALIVSDPLHMKRSVALAEKIGIDCKPSPTQTSMYRSFGPKFKSLVYETFFYTGGRLAGKN